jgi:hypothetical protein
LFGDGDFKLSGKGKMLFGVMKTTLEKRGKTKSFCFASFYER